MISTQMIRGVSAVPKKKEGWEIINVLRWKNSKWKKLCPYELRTDGEELCHNKGGVLFENFYQGCKVYDYVYENKVYPSKYQQGDDRYLLWHFEPKNRLCDAVFENNTLNYELYYRWRNSLWDCKDAIRYPNGIHNRKNTQFALVVDKDGNEKRYNYIEARKKIYMREYIRLVRNTKEYKVLLDKLKEGKKLMICEIDVPANNKKGEYGKDCDADGVCEMNMEKLNKLLEDENEAFGHGLCLSYALLKDLENDDLLDVITAFSILDF